MRAGTEIRADERAALMAQALRMPVLSSVAFVYPRLFALHDLPFGAGELDEHGVPQLPATTPLSQEKLDSKGVFVLDDAVSLLVWVGRAAPTEFLQAVLQVPSMEGVDCSRLRVLPLDNPISAKVYSMLNAIRSQRPHVLQAIRVVTAKDAFESRFLASLIEDRAQASMSYVEFLCHIHRQIQGKFN